MIDSILEACPDQEFRAVITLVRFGGLRCPSEVKALRWEFVDWAERRLRVYAPKQARHPTKKCRTIPLFPEIREPLERRFEAADDGAELVLPTIQDITPTALTNRLERLCKHLGLITGQNPGRT